MDISPYVGGEASLPGQDRVIKLASNESALGPSPRAMAAYRDRAEELHRYPDGAAAALRAALARTYGLDVERIVCGNGSDELLTLLGRAYAGPGDEIVYSAHGFAMYPIITRAVGATEVVAAERDLTSDVDALLGCVSERTRLVFLANPNNPTGTYIPADELARLHAGLPDDCLLVVDAAYAEYISRNDYENGVSLVETSANVVMTRTFSKIYGLGGLRVGWAYGPAAVADVLNRVRNPFNVNAGALAAATAAVDDVAYTDRVRAHNDVWLPWFARECEALGLTVNPSVGNFVIVRFPDEPGRDATAANAFLNGRGIIPRKVANYGLPGWLRITIGTEDEMRATVDALAAFVAGD